MMKITKMLIFQLSLLVLIALAAGGGMVLAKGQDRRDNIESRGIIKYADDAVVIDSSDLTYLADQIDGLEYSYKSATVDALNQIGTFYASADGTITHNKEDNAVLPGDADELSFGNLYQGIVLSQAVDHLADVRPAADNNLSPGTAAWVNGNLIIGNGADNRDSYNQGYVDGMASLAENVHIEYTRHEHSDECYEVQNVTCYTTIIMGSTYERHCPGCQKEIPDGKTVYRNFTVRHTLCGLPDSTDSYCTEHDSPPGGSSHTYEATVCVCGKTENTIESATIVFP